MRYDNKKITLRIFAAILAVIWMGVIFSFSGQNSEESTEVSVSVSYKVVESADRLFGLDWQDSKILEVAKLIEDGVRKTAHMIEYGILAVFVGMALGSWESPIGKTMINKDIINLLICLLYASSDEIHQLFVEGRHGCVKDVFIDAVGSLIIICIVSFICYRKSRKNKNESVLH